MIVIKEYNEIKKKEDFGSGCGEGDRTLTNEVTT